MKKRNGFVSNSSSSSFVLLGKSFVNNGEDETEEIQSKARSVQLSTENGRDDDHFYLGLSLSMLPEDLTLPEMRNLIAEKISSIGIETTPDQIRWHEESCYD